ncbi:MAG TPA: PASTA domain-containing protein, partial [Candidatus Binatia bacterium]
ASVYGGVVAAPAFGNIARGALRYLAVAPGKTDPMPATAGPAEPALRRALTKETTPDADARENGTPDFLGLSLREAVEKARAIKVNVKMHGHGHVIKQHPLPGAVWTESRELVLNLQG